MSRYKLTLQVLSPIHIGSGLDIDPLEYMAKDGIFYRLDLPAFLQQMEGSLRAEFNRKASEPNPVVLRDFIHRHVDPKRFYLFKADAGDFQAVYDQNLANPNTRLQVTLMTRSPGTWRAYIPGSSIKGAIRTAVVSELAKTSDRIHRSIDPNAFERNVLGYSNARHDPFRCLKISDAVLPEAIPTFIDKVQIFKLKAEVGPDPAGIQMFYEQVFSMLDEETIEAEGVLELDEALPTKTYFDSKVHRNKNAVSMSLSVEQLIEACRAFYVPKMQSEHEQFYRSNPELEQHSRALLDVAYGENEFPVRLGRFSHVECTTVDTFRQPRTRRDRNGHNLPWGTTRTLSGGKMPMGWAKVSLTPCR